MGRNIKRENIFHFKQFSIKNDISAMKVGTDGVLLGAWANVDNSHSVLDVGAGSGLISLMLAQRCNALIYGIEIDHDTASEAYYNIKNSIWADRIKIIEGNFNDENLQLSIVDHIVSNPPFFNNGIIANENKRAIARHTTMGLDFSDIISASSKLLSDRGKISLISPIERYDDILFEATMMKLNLSKLTKVYSRQNCRPIRFLWEFSRQNCELQSDELAIRDANNEYTSEYIGLTKDYYLNF